MSKRIGLIGTFVFLVLIGLAIAIYFLLKKVDYFTDVNSNSPIGKYQHFAISTDASECAPLAKDILKKNGTAVDAAITTLLCMSLVLPHSLGLGGGSFMTYYDKETGKGITYDGREQAALHVKTTKFNKYNLQNGLLSISVPGELAIYMLAHKEHGKLNWSELFEGPIKLARNGVKVNAHLAKNIQKNKNRFTKPLRELLTNKETGQFLVEGDTIVNENLAITYEKIANSPDPIKLFYRGELTDIMVEELNETLTHEDFKNYQPKRSDAIVFDLDDENLLLTSSSPSSGVILGFIMKLIAELKDTFIKEGFEYSKEETAWYYHQMTEILKHAYSRRASIADPSFNPIGNEQLLKDLTTFDRNDSNSKYFYDVLEQVKNSKKTHNQNFYGGKEYFIGDNGTAHMSIIDQWGNAISVTSTINIYFGSCILSKTGIIFNDENDDFSIKNIDNYFGLPASKANIIEPGKRPASSMCPIIVVDKKNNEAKLSMGAAGGSLIISGLAQALTRILYLNQNLKVAIDQWRFHNQLYPNEIQYEVGFNEEILKILNKTYGHSLSPIKNRRCIITGISRDHDGLLYSNTDYRKGGSIDGE